LESVNPSLQGVDTYLELGDIIDQLVPGFVCPKGAAVRKGAPFAILCDT
jgi:hypothetical protein